MTQNHFSFEDGTITMDVVKENGEVVFTMKTEHGDIVRYAHTDYGDRVVFSETTSLNLAKLTSLSSVWLTVWGMGWLFNNNYVGYGFPEQDLLLQFRAYNDKRALRCFIRDDDGVINPFDVEWPDDDMIERLRSGQYDELTSNVCKQYSNTTVVN